MQIRELNISCQKRLRHGFTLLEMTIVLFIIGLLILIIAPNIAHQKDRANSVHAGAMTTVVQTQLDTYLDSTDKKTASLGDLEKAGYLTDKQVKIAEKEGIKIDGKQVKTAS
ncbi:prepilin-type N-terminal cleavage/methylation domain-containing protein [Secundilactobacillus folii]|uniref:Prepilin-type N-terminal cleavage/methylation domain-containing protein n=1 Tax=Secundilactobacillus folii TaxID=2678357 RepID=A0A7X2XX58_9LACO|nr:prepilin-type N-terminal cleavage/methylation domain-containing protein [Secundilactobacillus folii]MTV83229.1 prepilin-type N-terminal cleavage/methylation domain-containing protein [Secundilactobacillus folii]